MAQLIVRNLDDEIKKRLKQQADEHGISMEAEIRLILASTLKEHKPTTSGLGSTIAKRFVDHGLEQPLPELSGQSIDPIDL